MNRKRKNLVPILFLVIIGIVILTNLFEGGSGPGIGERIGDMFGGGKPMEVGKAEDKLGNLVEDVSFSRNLVKRRANVDLAETNLLDTLPDIEQFPPVAPIYRRPGTVTVEIFSSSEKAGKDTDGWLVEVVRDFNERRVRLASGSTAQVSLRKIPSGTGAQFIASGKYRPHAITPSNALWIKFIEAYGVKTRSVRERLVGNVAGVVMKKTVADTLRSELPSLDLQNLVNAVVQGKAVTGYTNPYASSTGLNFLVSVLNAFSETTDADMLKPEIVSAFESFQANVPFVAMTTLQMRDSVQRNGQLDAFVMEYQTYVNTDPRLSTEHEFIPFGVRHDNPLYAVGEVSDEELEVLELLARHAEGNRFKSLADRYGFNALDEYQSSYTLPEGSTLLAAQRVWKENKDAGRPITAIFLADVSGSMRGFRLNALQKALISGAGFISENNEIGLVTFSDRVNVSLMPKKFDLIHKSAFTAAVQDLAAGGNTAMYDGVAVSLKLLIDVRQQNPGGKYMLFVLTDGETNRGMELSRVARVIEGIGIPVYTIGYAKNIDELKRLSTLVEAASINANEGDVAYKIGNLLNAQM